MNHLSSVNSAQIEHFAKDSKEWWNENGPFEPLHKINPARLVFIKKQICDFYGSDIEHKGALENLDILDIGCGGGLVCEPLARLGAKVTGLDADPQAIEIAKEHAKEKNLDITYTYDDLHSLKQQFDVVLALEVLEHVDNIHLCMFIEQCTKVLKPGGLIIFSTLNRTVKSFALGIIAAEYILRWVPEGTHSWKNFIKPSELTRFARPCNLEPLHITGITYNILKDEFTLSKNNCDVNFLMSFVLKK